MREDDLEVQKVQAVRDLHSVFISTQLCLLLTL